MFDVGPAVYGNLLLEHKIYDGYNFFRALQFDDQVSLE